MDRFWNKVRRGAPDECWPWLAAKSNGYGLFMYEQGVLVRAHRVAAYLAGIVTKIKAPADKRASGFVLHTCDTASCCNPAHLVVGTYAQNNAQKIARKRHPRRYPAHGGVLQAEHIAHIHTQRARGATHKQIARDLKCSTRTVSRYLKT